MGDKYTYDFASHKSDLVFISLGGNDYGRIQPTDEEFTAGMIKFIRQVRSVNPDSVILSAAIAAEPPSTRSTPRAIKTYLYSLSAFLPAPPRRDILP